MSQNDISLPSGRYEARLAKLLDEQFNLQELKDLCLDLNVDFENIAGSIKREKAQELTNYFARRDVLDQLVAAIKSARPDVMIKLPQAKTLSSPKEQSDAYIAYLELQSLGAPPRSFQQLAAISSILEGQKPSSAGQKSHTAKRKLSVGRKNAGVFLKCLTDTELLLVSFNDAVPLLQCVLDIASEAKEAGSFAMRAAVHSATLPAHSEESGGAIPDEFRNLTRSTMLLGKDGHILATAHVAEALRRNTRFEPLLHGPLKCEVKYHVRVEIHNIYDEVGGKFGNPTKPNPTAPIQVLQAIKLPNELRCAKPQPITLTFSHDVDYAKVVFSFRNSDLQVSCDGLGDEDCTFDYYSGDDNNTKVFDLWAVKAGEETLEPISIRCFDAANELMGPPVRARVKLRRRTPEPAGLSDVFKIPLWAWDRFICLPIHLKVVALLAVIVLGSSYAAANYQWDHYDRDKERFLRAVHIWPPHYLGEWSEAFTDTDDHRPNPERWRNAPTTWSLGQQEGGYKNDKALIVHGDLVGLSNLGDTALYDFKVSLRFSLLASQPRISWILRAQNSKDYYLFVLTLPPQDGIKARINGFIYRNGKQQGQLTISGELPYDHQIPENSTLFVYIEASGDSFKHKFISSLPDSSISNVGPEEKVNLMEKYFDQKSFPVDFSDPLKSYRWGYLGFRGLGPDDTMKIEEVMVSEAS